MLKSSGFALQFFHHPAPTANRTLHVYLEGDGRPWEGGLLPAAEPTTRSSVVLPLLAIDSAPALYLARPCYNGHAEDPGCQADLWTDGRYSEAVVNTMAQALVDFCTLYHYPNLILIGHSGGGALALLLAERLPNVRAVVTLAANYDIDSWTDYHRYLRLTTSLNPAKTNSVAPEWHILGRQDANVPPVLFESSLRQRRNSSVEIIDADHSHGWERFWPQLLARLEQLR